MNFTTDTPSPTFPGSKFLCCCSYGVNIDISDLGYSACTRNAQLCKAMFKTVKVKLDIKKKHGFSSMNHTNTSWLRSTPRSILLTCPCGVTVTRHSVVCDACESSSSTSHILAIISTSKDSCGVFDLTNFLAQNTLKRKDQFTRNL